MNTTIRTLRRDLIRARRRAQMRYRVGQVLNATLYLIVVGGACVVLLSL